MIARPGKLNLRWPRRAALVVGLVSTLWASVLLVTEGVTLHILGLRVTSHDPLRPLITSIVGFVAFIAAGGRVSRSDLQALGRRLRDRLLGWLERTIGVDPAAPAWLAAALAVAVLFVSLSFNTRVIGGSDSYGYVSQAILWSQGTVKTKMPRIDQIPWPRSEWTLTPLGYYPRIDSPDGPVMVPAYSPGLPLLMAAVKVVAGERAMFFVVPLFAALLVVSTYGIGARLACPMVGLTGAWLVATSPSVVAMAVQPMTDVPTAGTWAVTFWLLLASSRRAHLLAGVGSGVAVLIRPNHVFAIAVFAVWRVVETLRSSGSARRVQWQLNAAFAAGLLPGLIAVAFINDYLNGSPLRTGYGDVGVFFAAEHFWGNARRYLIWLIETQTPFVIAGVVALFLPVRRLWPREEYSHLCLIAGFTAALWLMYCFFLVFDVWWYLRFVLASFPFIMVGVGAVAVAAAQASGPTGRLAIICVLLAMGCYGVGVAYEKSAFELWRGDRHYPSVAVLTQQMTDERSVIVSRDHSGSMRFYGGRLTLRYDMLAEEWLDRSVAWLTNRGVHVYLLLDDSELRGFESRFAGARTLARLHDPPLLTYEGGVASFLFDLSFPRDADANVTKVYETYDTVPPRWSGPLSMTDF